MPLSNTVLNLNLVSEGVGSVARSTIPVPSNTSTPVLLAAANANRKGLVFYNNSVGNVLIEFGTNPTSSTYAVKLNPEGYYELPFQYTGSVHGLWEVLGGEGILVREFT